MSAVSAAAPFAGVAVRAAAPGRRATPCCSPRRSASDKFARTHRPQQAVRPPSRSANADNDTRRADPRGPRRAFRDADAPPCPRRPDPDFSLLSLRRSPPPQQAPPRHGREVKSPSSARTARRLWWSARGPVHPRRRHRRGPRVLHTCCGGICGACIAKCVEGLSGIDHRDITDLAFTLDEEEQAAALLPHVYPVGDITLETRRLGDARGGVEGRHGGDRWTRTHQADGRRAQGTLISRALPGGLGAESERRTKPARVPRCMNT